MTATFRASPLNQKITDYAAVGWRIESRTNYSAVMVRRKLNNPAWFLVSLVTAPFVFGLGFVVWGMVAAYERSRRLYLTVDQNGLVQVRGG